MPYIIKLKVPKTGMFTKGIRNIYDKEVARTLDIGLENFRNQVVFRVPIGATKRLVNSVMTERKGDTGKVFVNAKPYDIVVERGRRAAPVSKNADNDIIRWLRLSPSGQKFVAKIRASMAQKGRVTNEQALKRALFLLKISKKHKPTKGKFYFRNGIRAGKKITKEWFSDFPARISKGLVS
jgi:hypothetical protein